VPIWKLLWIRSVVGFSPAAPRATSRGIKWSGEGWALRAWGAFVNQFITSSCLQQILQLSFEMTWRKQLKVFTPQCRYLILPTSCVFPITDTLFRKP
jgi:hypothetical protein